MTICSSLSRNGATSLLEREIADFLVEAMDVNYALFFRHITIICDSLAEWLGRSTIARETTLSRVLTQLGLAFCFFSKKIEGVFLQMFDPFLHIFCLASRIVNSQDRVFKRISMYRAAVDLSLDVSSY